MRYEEESGDQAMKNQEKGTMLAMFLKLFLSDSNLSDDGVSKIKEHSCAEES